MQLLFGWNVIRVALHDTAVCYCCGSFPPPLRQQGGCSHAGALGRATRVHITAACRLVTSAVFSVDIL
jgi:hypothetical protein